MTRGQAGVAICLPLARSTTQAMTATPVTISPVTLMPNASTTPDDDIRAALGSAGLTAAEITKFEKDDGFKGLKPIATFFGAPALTELFGQLR